ncbi:hypothetical protein JCM5350_006967 [Sporobolomyces pararoseus]
MNFNNDFAIYGNSRQVIGGGEAQQTSYPQTLLDEYGFPLQPYDLVTADAHHQQTYHQYDHSSQPGYQQSLPHMQQQNPFTYHSQQQNPYNYSQHQTQQHSGPHTFVPPHIFNYWPQTAPPPQQSSFPTYSTPSVFSAPSDSSLSTIQPHSSGAVPASSNLPNHGDMDFQIRMAQTQIAGLEKDVEEAQKEYDALADQLSLDRLFQEMSAEPNVEKHAQLEYEYEQAKKELKDAGSTRTRRQTRLNEARKRLSKLTNSRGREVTTGKVTGRKDNPESESNSSQHPRLSRTLLSRTATSAHSSDTFSTHHTVPSTALNTSSFTSLIPTSAFNHSLARSGLRIDNGMASENLQLQKRQERN